MGLAGLIQLGGDPFALDHISHLHLAVLPQVRRTGPVQQLPSRKGHYRQDENDGDDIDNVEFSNAFCFLFHGILRKRRAAPEFDGLSSGQVPRGIV